MGYKCFGFKNSRNIGTIGENLFVKSYPKLNPQKSKNSKYDFKLKDGTTTELKTDTYSMDDVENFFMEALSNIKTETLGGPWQAYKNKIDHFVYLFLADKTFFWFEPKSLCAELNKLIKDLKPVKILNKRYETLGYKISRIALKKIIIKEEAF